MPHIATTEAIATAQSGAPDNAANPALLTARLAAELVAQTGEIKRLLAGGVGGGTGAKLVTVADDAAFAALTSAEVNVGDFVYLQSSAVAPYIADCILQLVTAGSEGVLVGYAVLGNASAAWLSEFLASSTAAAAAVAIVNGNPIAPSSVATNLIAPTALLEQRNGTTAQLSAIYGTWTSTTNYERLKMCYNSGTSTFQIGTEKGSGGGSARALDFIIDGNVRAKISATGGYLQTNGLWTGGTLGVDRTIDIGAYNPSISLATSIGIVFESTSTITASKDAGLFRLSAGVVGVGNGTAGDFSGFAQDLYRRKGTGTPEAVVTAPVGAVFHRTDGGAGTSFYVKESGAGNTGWVAK